MIIGAAASPRLWRDPSAPVPLEQVFLKTVWQRTAGPILSGSGVGWDANYAYLPSLVRYPDYTPYRDPNGNLHFYYLDAEAPDETGLALCPDFDNITRHPNNPVLPVGPNPSFDAGDTQVSSVFRINDEHLIHYQANSNAEPVGTDDVAIARAVSPNGWDITRDGLILPRGTGGDALDQYVPKFVPAGHDGLPKLFFTGHDAAGERGIMVASSASGSRKGPWARMSDGHRFIDGASFLGDVIFDGGLYHILYSRINVTGIVYATSPNALTITYRKQLVAPRSGQWDNNPYNGMFFKLDGRRYILFNSGGTTGIGYVSA